MGTLIVAGIAVPAIVAALMQLRHLRYIESLKARIGIS